MSSFEHLDELRKQNKELLTKLKQQTEKLQRLKLDGENAEKQRTQSSECETDTGGDANDGNQSLNNKEKDQMPQTRRFNMTDPVFTTVTVDELRTHVARDALCKQKTRSSSFSAIRAGLGEEPVYLAAEGFTPVERKSKQSWPSENTMYTSLLQDQANSRLCKSVIPTDQRQPRPSLLSQDREQRGLDRVTFQSSGEELESSSERRRMQPLLGYDWIAGLLDAESSLPERSEQFFSELRSFRQVNKDECVHTLSSGIPVVTDPWLSSLEDDVAEHEEPTPDTHQCTFCFRINSRLFAAPLDPQAACPVCKMPKAKHPHSENEPAFIRVSIPRSTLLPAYKYKAHRRCSFDPSDSLGLPSHCLSGWSNSSLKTGSQMSSLDLRSSMKNKTTTDNQPDLSGSRVSGSQHSDQLLDVSRLTRYHFQHLRPARTKASKTSYPVY